MPSLQLRDFKYAFKQHFIQRFSFLRALTEGEFDHRFERELSQIIVSKVLYQGQVLFRRNQVATQRLYLSELSHFIVSNGPVDYA